MSAVSFSRSFASLGLAAAVCLWLATPAGENRLTAQTLEPDSVMRSWDVRDGLPAAPVSDICRTTNGYLWLATRRGLVRFDGARFKLLDPQNTPQLRTNVVTSLLAEPDGGLWAGTPDGLFHFQDSKPGAPEMLEVGTHLAVNALATGPPGTVWALGAANELIRVVGRRVEGRIQGPGGLPIRAIASDESGRLVVLWSNALHTVSNGQFARWPSQGTGKLEIQEVTASRNGYVWIASSREARMVNEAGDFLVAKADPVSKSSPRASITDLLEDRGLTLRSRTPPGTAWTTCARGWKPRAGGPKSPAVPGKARRFAFTCRCRRRSEGAIYDLRALLCWCANRSARIATPESLN